MKLIATVTKRLSTGNIVAGEPFEVTNQDGERLKKMGWAKEVGDVKAKPEAKGNFPKGTFQTRALKAETPAAPSPSSESDSAPAEAGSEDISHLTKAELLKLALAEGVMVSATDTKAEIVKEIEKGRYHRRDMRPEE